MPVTDKIQEINDTIKALASFIQTYPSITPDFQEYLKTIGANRNSAMSFQAACFNYIFERRLGETYKSIPELYMEKNDLKAGDKKLVKSINTAISSVFELKKILKNGFELYNIINEKNIM